MRIDRALTALLVILCGLIWVDFLAAQEVKQLKPGVVKIIAKVDGKQKVGTGFIVSLEKDAAYIVTASHVIEGDPKPQVTFFTEPARSFTAKVIGIEGGDPRGLGALQVKGQLPSELVSLNLDQDIQVTGGEPVTLIGFPSILATPWSVATGNISGFKVRELSFQAPVEEGNSGGPLFVNGKVIGVVVEARQPFGYAIPSSMLAFALKSWGIPIHTVLEWREFNLKVRKEGFELAGNWAIWTDIQWDPLSSLGWLCGVLEEGGGEGYVGRGRLIRTEDKGESWRDVEKKQFNSGDGKFRWGGYSKQWDEIGPIKAMRFYRRLNEGGRFQYPGWIASATGIYATEDAGQNWKRLTPSPGDDQGYALFSSLDLIEGFREIYAGGWQGISHWKYPSGPWELEMPTFSYAIASIFIGPRKDIWAVGHASNNIHSGAIYYTPPGGHNWRTLKTPGIELLEGQFLADIYIDSSVAIAIGRQGLILRGTRTEAGNWIWIKKSGPTDKHLNSVAHWDNTFWIVGDEGVILYSKDEGEHWVKLPPVLKEGTPAKLNRIRFFEDGSGWIVGTGIVLRSKDKSS